MKTGSQYAAEVRTLRAAGFDFPAGRGYTLANPATWSSGQKAAVTRAANFNKRSVAAVKGAATRRKNTEFKRRSVAAKKGAATRRKRAAPPPTPRRKKAAPRARAREEFAAADIGPSAEGLGDAEIEEIWDDSAGDSDEEWDDIAYFDFDEGDDFIDEESDSYTEAE